MSDPVTVERIAARRAELDVLEEQPAKQLADVRVERDEPEVAMRVLRRVGEQIHGEVAAPVAPEAQVGGVRCC